MVQWLLLMLAAAQSAKETLLAIEERRSPVLESELKLQDLRANWPGMTAEAVADIDSTNEALKRLLRDPHAAAFGPLLLIADNQSAGKGRAGKRWFAERGRSLLFSLGVPWRLAGAPVPFAAALAVRDAIADVVPGAGRVLSFKWPNDVTFGGRKLAGILCEGIHRGTSSYLICGIGLNVFQQNWSSEGVEAASVSELGHLSERFDGQERAALLHAIVGKLQAELQELHESGGSASVLDRYGLECSTLGRDIAWRTIEGKLQRGRAEALTAEGGLIVMRRQGSIEVLTASEIMEVRPDGEEHDA